ncbi:zincin-like metallopeptidase domain-containing protein [Labrys monachus]|uniref:Antirestriction protein ArdC n=1 Tax=Labrys monachus TaxID=217067 RepID=A0ABU0FCD8_9HYPH|nr:zincin-like metallopeptidase domain-containing protein [Labrys monachus]MDQ0391799.1 antirestriction protein ArdC [Labrys monachus]
MPNGTSYRALPRLYVPVLRTFSVFNVDQFEKLPEKFYEQAEPKPEDEKFDAGVAFCKDTRINTHFGGNKACYHVNRDYIDMPTYGSFESDDTFFGTWCHELIHATGHKERLARQYGSRFGDSAYAFEELVAELGSAFLCAQLGYLPTTRTAASYIAHWLKVLENDHKAVVSAASYASHGARWLEEQAYHAVHDDTPEPEREDDLVEVV